VLLIFPMLMSRESRFPEVRFDSLRWDLGLGFRVRVVASRAGFNTFSGGLRGGLNAGRVGSVVYLTSSFSGTYLLPDMVRSPGLVGRLTTTLACNFLAIGAS